MSDIHGYSKRLEQALNRVRASDKIAEEDKKLLERFSIVLRTQRISLCRVAKYMNHSAAGIADPILHYAKEKERQQNLPFFINELRSEIA